MKTEYLMIDDEQGARSFADTLMRSNKNLSIAMVQERSLSDLDRLVKEAKPDGILMDLQLTKTRGANGEYFGLEGPSLAQEFRTRSHMSNEYQMPIVAISYKARWESIIGTDITATDLFDAEIFKGDVADLAERWSQLLVTLANGYKELLARSRSTPKNWVYVSLGLKPEKLESLDPRLVADLELLQKRPIHNVADFVLHSLLNYSGPLVDEDTLAIRLGVSLSKSGASWKKLLSKMPQECSYDGVFSGSYARWWMQAVLAWWRSLGNESPLELIAAQERVRLLRKELRLRGLKPVEASEKSPGELIWYRCVESGEAVDPPNGFMLARGQNMRSWHDPRFLSQDAALRHVQRFTFESGEKARLRSLARKKRGRAPR